MKRRKPTTEFSPCNLCGSQSAQPLYPKLGIIKCTQCGLVRAQEVPDRDRLKQLYSGKYFRSADSGELGYDDYIADRAKISKTFQERMEEIEKWTEHKGRLLDVGCAMGFSLEMAEKLGWSATGIEISEFACDFGRSELGMDISCCPLSEANFEPETFDVITMWDYIEHNPDPLGELARANRLLKPGGLLALTTPDISSMPARIWGPRWMGIKQEEHLFYFSRDTIKKSLLRCRFDMVRLEHVGKYIDIEFFAKRAGLYSRAIQRLIERLSGSRSISDKIFYVNPFDIMLVYGKKAGPVE